MAKVKQPCQKCQGKGVVPRSQEDKLRTNPITKGIMETYSDEICPACWGNGRLIVETKIIETKSQPDPSGD